jgi:hypothetical protein
LNTCGINKPAPRGARKGDVMKVKIKEYKKVLGNETSLEGLEEFWVKCLYLFRSDYSETYIELLTKENAKDEILDSNLDRVDGKGVNINGFTNHGMDSRHKYVLAHMPEKTSCPQNVPHMIRCPQSYVSEKMSNDRFDLKYFYESHSGNSLLTWWSGCNEDLIKLELFECSSFIKYSDEADELFR